MPRRSTCNTSCWISWAELKGETHDLTWSWLTGSYRQGADNTSHTLKQSFIQVLALLTFPPMSVYLHTGSFYYVRVWRTLLICKHTKEAADWNFRKWPHLSPSNPASLPTGLWHQTETRTGWRFLKRDINQDLVKQNLTHIPLAPNFVHQGIKRRRKLKTQLETYCITWLIVCCAHPFCFSTV